MLTLRWASTCLSVSVPDLTAGRLTSHLQLWAPPGPGLCVHPGGSPSLLRGVAAGTSTPDSWGHGSSPHGAAPPGPLLTARDAFG